MQNEREGHWKLDGQEIKRPGCRMACPYDTQSSENVAKHGWKGRHESNAKLISDLEAVNWVLINDEVRRCQSRMEKGSECNAE